jgi:hypothetical protein
VGWTKRGSMNINMKSHVFYIDVLLCGGHSTPYNLLHSYHSSRVLGAVK